MLDAVSSPSTSPLVHIKGHIKGIQKKSLSNGNHNVNNVIIKYFYIVKLNEWNILLLYK